MAKKKSASGLKTVFWWIIWITLTIVSFFAAVSFWTPVIADKFGSIHQTKAAIMWVTAVFGTWMVILVPLIIIMYSKVDKVYEDARLRREQAEKQFRSIVVDREKRMLPERVTEKLKGAEESIEGGHLVHLTLKDGSIIPNVFIARENEILGIYDAHEMNFSAEDVVGLELVDLNQPQQFFTNNWLRLDGVKAPV